MIGDVGVGRAGRDRGGDALDGRLLDVVVADLGDRRAGAMAHAGGAHDAHGTRVEPLRQGREQRLRAHELAGQAVADPHGQRRRRALILLHHIEMGVERRDLVDLGLGEAHLLGERREVGGREMAVAVLDQVQVLDQQVAAPRALAEQASHLVERILLDPAALGPRRAAPPAGARMPADLACGLAHAVLSSAAPGAAPSCKTIGSAVSRDNAGVTSRCRAARTLYPRSIDHDRLATVPSRRRRAWRRGGRPTIRAT